MIARRIAGEDLRKNTYLQEHQEQREVNKGAGGNLVLSRKVGQEIVIGGIIRITLVEIRGRDKVRLAINAPKDVTVHRGEIQDRIDEGDTECSSQG